MKMKPSTLSILAIALLGASFPALSYDGDWKRGRLYYSNVCTDCHKAKAGGVIEPTSRTKAEWAAYIQADKHAKGKESLKHYFSKPYRDSIKATNRVAAKFADVPDSELIEDVKAFLNRGAKDGDAPAKCS